MTELETTDIEPKKHAKDASIIFGVTAWAKALNMSPQTIHKRCAKIGIHFSYAEKIPAIDIFQALTSETEKELAMTRKLNAEAEAQERENLKESGQLVSVPEMERLLWQKIYLPMKVEMETMPEKLAALIAPNEIGRVQTILREWVEEMKKKCSEPKPKES